MPAIGPSLAGFSIHLRCKPLRSVFIPSAVNPTTGFLLLLGDDRIVYLDMTPEQAMKMIVSAGALVPARRDTAEKS